MARSGCQSVQCRRRTCSDAWMSYTPGGHRRASLLSSRAAAGVIEASFRRPHSSPSSHTGTPPPTLLRRRRVRLLQRRDVCTEPALGPLPTPDAERRTRKPGGGRQGPASLRWTRSCIWPACSHACVYLKLRRQKRKGTFSGSPEASSEIRIPRDPESCKYLVPGDARALVAAGG